MLIKYIWRTKVNSHWFQAKLSLYKALEEHSKLENKHSYCSYNQPGIEPGTSTIAVRISQHLAACRLGFPVVQIQILWTQYRLSHWIETNLETKINFFIWTKIKFEICLKIGMLFLSEYLIPASKSQFKFTKWPDSIERTLYLAALSVSYGYLNDQLSKRIWMAIVFMLSRLLWNPKY